MDWTRRIRAVLFDMDGTLLDSEQLTEAAVHGLLRSQRIDVELDCTHFHGVTWKSISTTLRDQFPVLQEVDVEAELQARFHLALLEDIPPVIPGAPQAVQAASKHLGTAIVTSNNRASVEYVARRLQIGPHLDHFITAEDCQRSKPDPQCYQIAAERLQVDCAHCLVFEDSIAGLQAARSAGMCTIAIGNHHDAHRADTVIADFMELPADFFESLGVA